MGRRGQNKINFNNHETKSRDRKRQTERLLIDYIFRKSKTKCCCCSSSSSLFSFFKLLVGAIFQPDFDHAEDGSQLSTCANQRMSVMIQGVHKILLS
jgi:hypothetical protein